MSAEKEQNLNNSEKERLAELARELEVIHVQKTNGQSDVVMQKLIKRLRDGDAYSAKIFLSNEADKFTQYREDAVPVIIEKLYGGSGSPWFTLERKMRIVKSESPK
ncbi:hypothetical protein A2662_02815 [Candidatus Giovannonibacteria bacterium RIFCSPHIGHO2_01_FULL_45_33]|uniref:Uncharacterized protein n=1 Tax=Candidatus Giovannonibacteria bacterium RIFCSPLOWO2_01_FULL_45_34 TaxID=1798351 RepID=A0A1F5X1J7_9BACT|nr:MAG: hypothetical protein A2662_02815 [Candidatus Giovannonibacteria bacterium RIFCSPHIGHO2_01_FULL_45_33]OGF70923.1 MAG: hypothetical protein A3C73_00920 [Candidatus Giovannonibacteria bacterium RIFCSPHIGHO2_02_FULL_44_11]OGF81723.1 MAG: hypothetical protein A2930_03930 [Candidatus Giovannonibacteria bacterium RIFCSPLOWO2_01_FULL_45_34]